MIPSLHFLLSLILFFVLYPYFGLISLLVFAGGWLVDMDHVLCYIFKFKKFSYKKAYKYFMHIKPGGEKIMNIFHTIEVWAVMFVLSFYSIYILMISLGLFMHILTDFISLLTAGKITVRYFTLTGWFLSRR